MKTIEEEAFQHNKWALAQPIGQEVSGYKSFLAGYARGKPKWISVEERLPEADTKQRVLTLQKDADGDYDYFLETWYYTRWEHLAPDTNYDDHHKCEITHWMELPSPPETEGGV